MSHQTLYVMTHKKNFFDVTEHILFTSHQLSFYWESLINSCNIQIQEYEQDCTLSLTKNASKMSQFENNHSSFN